MTVDNVVLDQFFLKVDGTDVQTAVLDQLAEIVVEDDLAQPAMFILRFFDPEFTLIDGVLFKLGAELEIGAANNGGQRTKLMTGEVTSVEIELDTEQIMLVVYGYDASHRLYRGHNTRTFLKKADSAIASEVIGAAGLTADVVTTNEQHEYVMQNNQTDMDFLRARAARVGYQVFADGKKVSFRPVPSAPPAAPVLEYGKSLLAFRARVSAVGQANSVEVRGWDPKQKKAIVGTASTVAAPNKLGETKNGGQLAQTAFSSAAKVTVSNQPVTTQAEATNLAQAILDQAGSNYLAAEGQCVARRA